MIVFYINIYENIHLYALKGDERSAPKKSSLGADSARKYKRSSTPGVDIHQKLWPCSVIDKPEFVVRI